MQFKLLAASIFCLAWLSACSPATPEPQDFPTRPAPLPSLTAMPVTPSPMPAAATSTLQPPALTAATELKIQAISSEGMINVHSGPGIYYPLVAKVSNNQVLQAVGIDPSGDWVQFKDDQAPDAAAWIYAPFTSFDRSANSLPVVTNLPTPPVTPTAVPPRAMGTIHVVYPDGQVNVRLGPGTNYAIIGKVDNGDVLNATGTIDSGDWVQFQYQGNPEEGTAWIYAPYTDYDRASRTLPLISNLPPTPAP